MVGDQLGESGFGLGQVMYNDLAKRRECLAQPARDLLKLFKNVLMFKAFRLHFYILLIVIRFVNAIQWKKTSAARFNEAKGNLTP